ncbi:MAG: N-acyl homoserine lactonase family protein [Alphaproteobacteria bacterium]
MKVYAAICGHLELEFGRLVADETSAFIRIPVPVYIIDHPKGLAVFDTGLRSGLSEATDPGHADYNAWQIQVDLPHGADLSSRIAAIGRNVRDVRYLVNSHLHFDHCGGNHQIPNAPLFIQKREWQAGKIPELQHKVGYDPRDFALGHDVIEIDGDHDLFGDGSVTLIPTYGHTPGHQSLKLRTASGDIVLTADACYFRSVLESLRLPRNVYDREAMRESLLRLRALQAAGAKLYFGHEPDDWRGMTGAPVLIGQA